jgi:hypothetical protein
VTRETEEFSETRTLTGHLGAAGQCPSNVGGLPLGRVAG